MISKQIATVVLATSLVAFPLSSLAGQPEDYPTVVPDVVTFAAEASLFGFDFDKDDIKDEDVKRFRLAVISIGQRMADNPNWILRIEGHTDETATETYNMGLASRRVDELASLLLQGGASASQIQRVPYGEINPLMDGHSDLAWATNRRIVARLIVSE